MPVRAVAGNASSTGVRSPPLHEKRALVRPTLGSAVSADARLSGLGRRNRRAGVRENQWGNRGANPSVKRPPAPYRERHDRYGCP